jgi:hypothetical protein
MTNAIQPPQIPQMTPEEANREMTPTEVRQLQETIANVRKIIARFHETRRRNNERMAGLRASTMWPQQVQQLVQATRQPQVEHQAVEQLRQFLRVIRGHEPTRQEMQEGIPNGLENQVAMGGIPFAVGAVAIALGSGVYSVFSYINDHEERIAQQTATPLERGMRLLSDNIWGVAAVGAVVGGVYVYHRTQTSGERKHERELEKIRAAKGMEENPAEGGEEEETFFSKAKTFVKNGLFPAEKNPAASPAQRLNAQFEKLTESEQDRFIAIINGEEPAEPEPEPEENPEEEEPEVEDEVEETEETEETEEAEENPDEDEGEEEQEESDD